MIPEDDFERAVVKILTEKINYFEDIIGDRKYYQCQADKASIQCEPLDDVLYDILDLRGRNGGVPTLQPK